MTTGLVTTGLVTTGLVTTGLVTTAGDLLHRSTTAALADAVAKINVGMLTSGP